MIMEKFTAQAGWVGEDGRELDDAKDFDTEEEAAAWLDDYHPGREMREVWQGRRLVASIHDR
jgi:hypothetical protein